MKNRVLQQNTTLPQKTKAAQVQAPRAPQTHREDIQYKQQRNPTKDIATPARLHIPVSTCARSPEHGQCPLSCLLVAQSVLQP